MTDTTRLDASTREVPLAPGGEVQVLLTANDATIRGTDRDMVTVRARGGEDLDDEVVITEDANRVSIRNAESGVRFGRLRISSHGPAALDIEVPRSATLTFKTLSGDVIAEGIGRDSRWSTASGDLRLVADGGSVTVDSMSGDVTVEATSAVAVRGRSVSGDIRLSAPRLDALQLSSTSGDLRIEAELGRGFEHTISSVSGDVHVHSSSPIRLESQTIAGDVRATGTHRAEGGRGRRTIVVGDGSVHLAVRTTSGDIRLRAGDAAEAVKSPPTAPPPSIAPVPASPAAPEPPVAPEPPAIPPLPEPWLVAEADAAPNLVRRSEPASDGLLGGAPETGASHGADSTVDRREQARLDILRALERGELDVAAASHRLEQLDEAGPRFFPGVLLMAADPLDQVLRLVAEGRLTAEEAAPILAALDEQAPALPAREPGTSWPEPPGGFGFDTPPGPARWPGPTTDPGPGRPSSTLRIQVRDAGRNVVNLRLPLAVGRFALDRVPGLSAEQVDRVREAMSSGFRGPILDVDDDGDGVRISIE